MNTLVNTSTWRSGALPVRSGRGRFSYVAAVLAFVVLSLVGGWGKAEAASVFRCDYSSVDFSQIEYDNFDNSSYCAEAQEEGSIAEVTDRYISQGYVRLQDWVRDFGFGISLPDTVCQLLVSNSFVSDRRIVSICPSSGPQQPLNEPVFGDNSVISDQSYVENEAITSVTLPAATGGDAPLTYTLSPQLPAGLDFNSSSRMLSGTPTAASQARTYTYTVTDADGDTASLTFDLSVTTADFMLSFGNESISNQSYVENEAITSVTLPAATGGGAPLTYTLSPRLPAGLDFNSSSRMLSGTPTAASQARTYTYTVTDADGDTASLTFDLSVTTADFMLSFGNESISNQSYVENEAITSVTLPAATGGDAPLTYTLSPRLPAGLDFNSSSRMLSGTPTAASQARTYTYTVTDADGDAASLTFDLSVTTADFMLSFGNESISNQSYVENEAITNVTLPAAIGGDAPLTYTLSPSLPTGLTFNGSTRVLSGTPTAASQARTYTYTVTDADGDTASLTFDISVTAKVSDEGEKKAITQVVADVAAVALSNVTANIGARFSAPTGSTGIALASSSTFGKKLAPSSLLAAADFHGDLDSTLEGIPDSRAQTLDLNDLLRSGAFQIALGASEEGTPEAGMGGTTPQWTVWDRGDLQFFESKPERGSTYDGDLKAGS